MGGMNNTTHTSSNQKPSTILEQQSGEPARHSRRKRMHLGGVGIVLSGLLTMTACAPSAEASDTSEEQTQTSTVSSESTDSDTGSEASDVAQLAQAFADTLDADQLAELYQDYSYENVTNWSNFPQSLLQGGMGGGPGGGEGPGEDGLGGDPDSESSSGRVGLQISTLDDEQSEALEALLQAALGDGENEGYEEVMQILTADDYLLQESGNSDYGSENYYIAFLGDPAEDPTWELQFGGHHLAVSNTYTEGELVSATPSFRGTEPTGEFTYDGETSDPMSQETDALTAMLESLSSEQLEEAQSEQNNLLLGPGTDWEFPEEAEGIAVSDLTQQQQDLVLAAIATYVDDLPEEEAAEYMEQYEAELQDTYISFSGNTDLSEAGDYVRIDGPSVWIELAMQNGVASDEPHIHSVWRDSETDYAGLTDTSDSAESHGASQ